MIQEKAKVAPPGMQSCAVLLLSWKWLSLTLLFTAALFIRSVNALSHVAFGFGSTMS